MEFYKRGGMFKVNKTKSNKAGFTLIEVVLVLAIGGLIFLLAFLAFGQATKNRRDTQRRSDAVMLIAELENSRGDGLNLTNPNQLGPFLVSYLNGTDNLINGGTFTNNNITYFVTISSSDPTGTVNSGNAFISLFGGVKCNGNTFSTPTGNARDYAVVVKLEKGQACRDNQ